jgi:outer membrane biosynthesis protein TonB
LLAYGFGISIVVHVLALPFVRSFPTASANEPVPLVLTRTRVPTPPPTPRPTPTPPATPRPTTPPRMPPQTVAPHVRPVKIVTLRAQAHAGGRVEPGNAHAGGDVHGAPGADSSTAPVAVSTFAATPVPLAPAASPQATPTPLSCSRPDVAAATLHAVEPDTPALAVQQGISGTVDVIVSLDAQSRVVATRIQSSPSAVLNPAAIAAARGSRFRTEVKDCVPVAADYIFSVEFSSQ